MLLELSDFTHLTQSQTNIIDRGNIIKFFCVRVILLRQADNIKTIMSNTSFIAFLRKRMIAVVLLEIL